jgi:probable rRNA maturation factor
VIRALYVGRWRIDLTTRDGVESPVKGAVLARTVAAAMTAAGAPEPASIGLILSNDAELAALNADHLGVQGSTDVLSFPLLTPETFPPHPGTAVRKPDGGAGLPFPLPPGRRQHLGDIVISVERAIEQAETGRGGQTGDVRWSASDEMRLLATHGALHICGWDHAEPAEESAMRALETQLLGSPSSESSSSAESSTVESGL